MIRRALALAALAPILLLASPGSSATRGELLGKQWQVSDLAPLLYAEGWTDAQDLATGLAVAGSESFWRDRAYNDNERALGDTTLGQLVRVSTGSPAPGDLLQVIDPPTGLVRASSGATVALGTATRVVVSRDVGVFQINIPAAAIGTAAEAALYDVATNVHRARLLYTTPTGSGIRGWTPWYGYTLRVYLRDTYQKIALRGLGNWLYRKTLTLPTDTLSGAPYEHKLAAPILNYEYRVVGLVDALNGVKAKLSTATVRRDWTLVREARADAANATLIAKR